MHCNIGKTDKSLRLFTGIILLVLGVVFNSWFGLIGILPIITAYLNCCPLYIPIQFSTLEKNTKK